MPPKGIIKFQPLALTSGTPRDCCELLNLVESYTLALFDHQVASAEDWYDGVEKIDENPPPLAKAVVAVSDCTTPFCASATIFVPGGTVVLPTLVTQGQSEGNCNMKRPWVAVV